MKSKKQPVSRNIRPLLTRRNVFMFCLVGILIITGFVCYSVGENIGKRDVRYHVASGSELDKARNDIISRFKKENSTDCSDPTDPTSPKERDEAFEKYLKVNKYANRAVFRGCNDVDSLVAKNPLSGQWEPTIVNVNISAKSNPVWQVECLADDILRPDTIVRPENSSIDTTNLVVCREIKERELIADILIKSGTIKRSELKQDDIDVYISAGEDF